MGLRSSLFCVSALFLVFASSVPASDNEQATLKALEGTWNAIRFVSDDQEGDSERIRGQRLVIQAPRFTLHQAQGEIEGTLHLDPGHDPAHLNATYTTKEGDNRAVPCIYQLVDDRLIICWGQEGRPSDFSAESGSGNLLMVFERAKGE